MCDLTLADFRMTQLSMFYALIVRLRDSKTPLVKLLITVTCRLKGYLQVNVPQSQLR